MREKIKNVGLILALIIAGVSLPTSIMSFMEKPTCIAEINNYYYNSTIIERYNTTVIEQSNNTGKQVIEPIIYLPAVNSGATFNLIWIELNAINEFMYATFFANSDAVDTSNDVIFRFIMDCTQTDESLQMLIYSAHTRTNNTAIFSWNLDNGVAINFNTTAQLMFIYEYTFDAADLEIDDWLSFALKLNEASRAVGIMYAEVEYIHI